MDKKFKENIFISETMKSEILQHNNFSNDVVGVFAFSMGIASLASSSATTGLASISFLFCAIWMVYKGLLIFTTLKRYYEGKSLWEQVLGGLIGNMIFLLGLGFVGLVAFEVITIQTFTEFSFSNMISELWHLTKPSN